MIVVIASVVVRPPDIHTALALSLEHVARSRNEPGCLAHGVSQDAEAPLRLVFVERWLDRAALEVHFRVPASIAFASSLAGLAAEPPVMELFDATKLA